MKMQDAPKDGTRILALCVVKHYSRQRGWEEVGHVVQEIWWTTFDEHIKSRWHVWCGTPETQSTDTPMPITWLPIPTELTWQGAQQELVSAMAPIQERAEHEGWDD